MPGEGKDIVQRARESWRRILNMDGGQPQTIAAGLWASIYADALLVRASKETGNE